MALPTEEILKDLMAHGMGIALINEYQLIHVPAHYFFNFPEPGERSPWGRIIRFEPEPYDDGGGAAIAAYQYGRCPFRGSP